MRRLEDISRYIIIYIRLSARREETLAVIIIHHMTLMNNSTFILYDFNREIAVERMHFIERAERIMLELLRDNRLVLIFFAWYNNTLPILRMILLLK